jgi:peptide/nickel transport system substrate-binding protein
VQYAVDKTGYQRAYGGDIGGKIATNLMPPVISGSEQFDLYETPNNAGDVEKAKQALTACGQPNGFSTNISYRAERPKEKATAEALQQSLQKAGIQTQLRPFPLADYTKLYAGKPDYAKANNLGLMVYGWGADWPDGFGFLSQITDSRVIRDAGNTNLAVKDPKVDQLIDKAMLETDKAAREKAWVEVDRATMEGAYYVPGIWAKGLLYRPENLTNVFVTDGTQMYDYLALGTTRK